MRHQIAKSASKASGRVPKYRHLFNYRAHDQTSCRLQVARDGIQLSFSFPDHVSADDRSRMQHTLTESIHDHLSRPWTSSSKTSARTVLVKEAEDGNPKSTGFACDVGLFMKSVIADATGVSNLNLRSLMRSVNYRTTVIVGVSDLTDVMSLHSDSSNASMSPTSSEDRVTLVEQAGTLSEMMNVKPTFSIAISVGDTKTSFITIQSTLGMQFGYEFAEVKQEPEAKQEPTYTYKRHGMIFDRKTTIAEIIDNGLGAELRESEPTDQARQTSEGTETIAGDSTDCGSADSAEPEDLATIVTDELSRYHNNPDYRAMWSYFYTTSHEGSTREGSPNGPTSWMNKTSLFWLDRRKSIWGDRTNSSVGTPTGDDDFAEVRGEEEEPDGFVHVPSNEKHDDFVYIDSYTREY